MGVYSPRSHARGVNYPHARFAGGKPRKVPRIERQQMRDAMSVTNGHQSGIMDLFADDAQRLHQSLPRGENIRRIDEQRKDGLKRCCGGARVFRRQPQPICFDGTCRNAPKLNQVLWSNVQNLTAPVQLNHRATGNCIERIRRIGKPAQYTCVNQVCH